MFKLTSAQYTQALAGEYDGLVY